MHFTTGQLIFATLVMTAFIALTFWAYRKDRVIHKTHYKGWWKVLAAVVLVFVIYYILVHVLN